MQGHRDVSGSTGSRSNPLYMMFLVSVIGLVGCAPKRYITYFPEQEVVSEKKPKSEEIDFYFSELDSIKPYVHRFITGSVYAEAPNLDPRDFVCPDSLVNRFIRYQGPGDSARELLGVPARDYEIVGEVEVVLARSPAYAEGLTVTRLNGTPKGPHKKHWVDLLNVYWKNIFGDIRRSARDMGTDAILEIFCGKGVYSGFYPPRAEAHSFWGGGTWLTYPEVEQWKLMGLAVRWKD